MNNYTAFYESVQRFPDRLAVETELGTTTYDSLNTLVNRIEASLLENNAAEGDIIGVYMEPSLHYIATILAVNKIGGVFMPLESKQPVKRLGTMLKTIVPGIVLTTTALVEGLRDKLKSAHIALSLNLLVLEADDYAAQWIPAAEKVQAMVSSPESQGLKSCYLFYTSGSTGEPKAIEGSVEGLDHFIKWEIAEFDLDHTVKVPLLAPLSFDVSLRDIFLPLYTGGTICIPSSEIKHQMSDFIEWLSACKINHIHMVPSLFRLITAEAESGTDVTLALAGVNYILLAGEALYYSDVASWRKSVSSHTNLVNIYGPSETSLAKLFFRINENTGKDREIVPIGYPIAGAKAVTMKNGLPCRTGEIGELYIKTLFRSRGYFGDQLLTNEKFIAAEESDEYGDISYKTGDFAKINEAGVVQFIGRQDNLVKINGNRVELQEVEGALNAYPLIGQTVVVPTFNAQQEPELVCYYLADKDADLLKLKDYLSDLLPAYMFPSYFIRMEQFPLNFNGKVDRKALPPPPKRGNEADYIPCENEVEARIEQIWMDILKVDKVGRNTSFFTIGGSSLKAIQIISRIQKEFNVLIKLANFFAKPMIKDLAVHVNSTLVQQ